MFAYLDRSHLESCVSFALDMGWDAWVGILNEPRARACLPRQPALFALAKLCLPSRQTRTRRKLLSPFPSLVGPVSRGSDKIRFECEHRGPQSSFGKESYLPP